MDKPRRVTVLMGGLTEREPSLMSGRSVANALEEAGFEVATVDVTSRDPVKLVEDIRATNPDVIFNDLAGQYGEDGIIQGILNMLQIPYAHSGVLASAVAMNKDFAKKLFASNGLPVAASEVVYKNGPRQTSIPKPHVIKPVSGGSSIDLFVLQGNTSDVCNPLADWNFSSEVDAVLVEQYVPGRDITVAVMGDKAIGVLEIVSSCGTVVEYDDKYVAGQAKHIMPAALPTKDYEEACRLALKVHQLIGCHGISRADLRYDDITNPEKPVLVLLEVNTQPSLSPIGLFTEIATYNGISIPHLVRWMVEHARCS